MWFQGTSLWFSNSIPIDWSYSCSVHDKTYMEGTFLNKIRGDFLLAYDVWLYAPLGDTWWKRLVVRANALGMLLATLTIGTIVKIF